MSLLLYTQTFFSSLSDIHECLGGLQMAPSSLNKETAGYNSPHDLLMKSASGIGYTSKKLSKMAGNLASYPVNNWWIDKL